MPSELTQSVRTAINNFLSVKTSDDHGEIAIDVLRAIRDEAALLMEKQTIFDTFDSDPMKFYDGDIQLMKQIERMKKILHVISCSRCTTKDGFSRIDTVVEIVKDAKMNNSVNESIRLTFNFQREKIYKDNETKEDNEDSTQAKIMNKALERKQNSPTHITYDIDYSKDHGESKRLITIEVFAKNDYPSVEEAIPMDDADMAEVEEYDEHGNKMEEEGDKTASRDTMSVSSTPDDKSNRDRYAAYIDPEALQDFLVSSGLELNAENSLFFLMTFPFCEHEWDIFGFLLDCVFGGDGNDSDEYEDMADSDDKDDL